MSRCFPFPPPGYEPKARTGIIDLSTKEEHREKKKHKKETRDREKRDKDRSKDKRKEKKDQKHKDRKKEKDRDKGRTSEDSKAEGQAQRHNELHIEENLQKIDEGAKRTRVDGASNPMVGKFTNSIQRKFEGVGDAITLLGKERVAANKVFSVQSASVQRRNDSSVLPVEDAAISTQRRSEYIGAATAMEKERIKMHEKVTVGRGIAESRNHGIYRSMETVSALPIRKTEVSTAEMENQKCGERSLVSSSVVVPKPEKGNPGSKILASSSLVSAKERKDVLGISVENISSFQAKNEAHSRILAMDSVPKLEKERDIHQKVEGKIRTQGKQTEDRKLHKNSNHTVKKSIVEDIKHNKLMNFGKKDQVSTLNNKPLAPHKDDAIGFLGADNGTVKKRKSLDTNGYLRENGRPVKIPSMTSSSQSLVNGRPLELLHLSSPSTIPLQSAAMNKSRPDRLLENKERKINGNQITQLPSEPPVSGSLTKNSNVSSVLLPHPDSKYLRKIYAVPKMVESPEIDDQEWLFSRHDSLQKSKRELEAADRVVPQVSAEALRIESADVLALPYVVPF